MKLLRYQEYCNTLNNDTISKNEELNFKQMATGVALGAASLFTTPDAAKTQIFSKDKIETAKNKLKDIKNIVKSDNKTTTINSKTGYDDLHISLNGKKIKITKKIQFENGSRMSQKELDDIVENLGMLSGITSESLAKFLTAETGPKGTNLEGKDYKIVVCETFSKIEDAGKMASIQKSKGLSNESPHLVTKFAVIENGEGYTIYSFTKVE